MDEYKRDEWLNMDFKVYCVMHVGPRENQEDCILIKGEVIQARQFEDTWKFSSNEMELLAICDGMGGLTAGEKASRFVCESLVKSSGGADPTKDIPAELESIQLSMEHDFNEECGTTIAGMTIAPFGMQVFNIGDSRVYRVSPVGIERLSHDHSIVQVLLDDGKITEQEAFAHPYRNLITAGMGPAFSYKWDLETIHLHKEPIEPEGGAYFICSDGVCDVLSDREIGDALGGSPVQNGPALMESLKAASLKDNTSFAIVEINP